MANVKITDLTAYTDPVSTDVLPIVDVGADVTKKVSIADLLENAGSGTAAAPGIAFDGDSDTGIYRPGANQVAISTNGTGRLFVDADGRVRAITTGLGINGTSQNGFDLDVNGLSIFRGSLYFDNHSGISGDTTLSAPVGQSLVFKRGTNESARIDSSGRLGLGTGSPSYTLDVAGSTSMARLGKLQILNDAPFVTGTNIDSGANTIAFGTSGNAPVIFFANNTERARIDSSGRLLVGTPTSTNVILEGAFQIQGTGVDAFATITRYTTSANPLSGPGLILGRSGSNTKGTNTIVASGNTLGYLHFAGANGSGFDLGASIRADVDGTPGASSDMPGRLLFSTTASGSSSPTERMRITSDAYVRLASGTGGIQFNGDTAAANALDDYEEGIWNVTLNANLTANAAYSKGYYVKIGSLVWIHYSFKVATVSGSNNVAFSGLPFANSSNTADTSRDTFLHVAWQYASVGDRGLTGYLSSNATSVTIFKLNNNGDTTNLQNSDLSVNDFLWVSGFYRV